MAMEYAVMSAALVAAVNAGVFLAFSDFIMPGFAQIAPTSGRQAMQAINTRVLRSVFLVLLMGLGPVAAGLAIWGWLAGHLAIVLGGLIYCLGVVGVTMFGNVPMNERLDKGADAAHYWSTYQRGWTRWNHVRTGSNVLAAFLLAYGAVAL